MAMTASSTKFDGLTLLMSRNRLRDIPWRIAKNKLVKLTLDHTILEALKTLSNNKIISAPVFDKGQFVGFTDMQQLVRYVVRLVQGRTFPDGNFWSSDSLRTTTIRNLVRGDYTGPITGEYTMPISENASLYSAFERMAREGQHRLAVQDSFGNINGVVCQSEMISFIAAHMATLSQEAKNTLVTEIRPYTFISTINENASALQGFDMMDQKLTSLNAVGVVDNEGVLTDVLSTHDLRGIFPTESHFSELWGSVKNFKAQARRRFGDVKYFPKTCRRTDTLETIVNTMEKNNVHRVFVVDASNRPIDVITQTDVMRYLLNASGYNWAW